MKCLSEKANISHSTGIHSGDMRRAYCYPATLLLESHLVLLTERSDLVLYHYAAPQRNYSSQIHYWTEKAIHSLASNGLTVLTGT